MPHRWRKIWALCWFVPMAAAFSRRGCAVLTVSLHEHVPELRARARYPAFSPSTVPSSDQIRGLLALSSKRAGPGHVPYQPAACCVRYKVSVVPPARLTYLGVQKESATCMPSHIFSAAVFTPWLHSIAPCFFSFDTSSLQPCRTYQLQCRACRWVHGLCRPYA